MRLKALLCPYLLRAYDHHRAVSVVNDGVGDTSHQRPPDAAETPAPHDYEPGAQFLGQVDDCLIATFSDPKVGFFHTPSRLFELLHLLVEHLLSISPYRFERLLIGFVAQAAFVYVVDGIRVSGRYGDGCNSEFVVLARSAAVLAASCASLEPSVASRILVGKMLIGSSPCS